MRQRDADARSTRNTRLTVADLANDLYLPFPQEDIVRPHSRSTYVALLEQSTCEYREQP